MSDSAQSNPRVFLVGAGPGSPGLLTLRGAEVLGRADFVLYDQLVPERLLDFAPQASEKICVRDLPGQHPDKYPHIHKLLIEMAKAGKTVVRLKGGDPLIFGRGGEEAEALRVAGIPYEIVPGVTAALAAGAYLEIPLTHREHASAIAFVTGHEDSRKPETRLDWQALAAFPGTLAIYMGVARLGMVARELIQHGKPGDTPVIAVHKASTGAQHSVGATLDTLEEAVRRSGLTAPAVVLIGPVVSLKPLRSWFEAKPLLGVRVLVTRPRHQAGPMMQQLERLGAFPVLLPMMEIREPDDWGPVDAATDQLRLGQFQWVVFTSANGVEAFVGRLRDRGQDLRALGTAKLAAIGPATAAALRQHHLAPDVAPTEGMNSEALAEALIERVGGERVLLVQADSGRELLRDQLRTVADELGRAHV